MFTLKTLLSESRDPAANAMAERAVVAGSNMCRVFAAGDDAVVATETGAEHRTVIDSCYRGPIGGAMTILTARGRQNMAGVFGFGDRAVMTEHTIADDIYVVKLPVESRMAVVADTAAGHMAGVFPFRNDAIVATRTAANYHGVVNPDNVIP